MDEDGSRADLMADVEALMTRIARSFGSISSGTLTPTQFMVVAFLKRRGPKTMSEVAEILGITMAGATGLVERLVRAGLLTRRRSDEDRRLVYVELTDEGGRVLEEARAVRLQHFRGLTSHLSEEDLVALRRILGDMLKGVQPS